MKKIPSIFIRDWNGDKNLVTREINPDCDWVFRAEGIASIKMDGTCCMVRAGKLFKRREIKPGQTIPADFESCGEDLETGKLVGWVPVGDGPDDQYHREAWKAASFPNHHGLPDGTYELLGPKVQGNPEKVATHTLVRHGSAVPEEYIPLDFDGLYEWLSVHDVEGLVWRHRDDGRMAKIKGRDFGHKRGGK